MSKRNFTTIFLFMTMLVTWTHGAEDQLGQTISVLSETRMLGLLFRVFNIGMLYCVSAIALMTLSQAVLLAASDGKGFSRKLNAWVAIRTIIGAALLVPSPQTGFSLIQDLIFNVMKGGVETAGLLVSNIIQVSAFGPEPQYIVSAVGQTNFTQMVSMSYCVYAYENRLGVEPRLVKTVNGELVYDFEYVDRNSNTIHLRPCQKVKLVQVNRGDNNSYDLTSSPDKVLALNTNLITIISQIYSSVKSNVNRHRTFLEREAEDVGLRRTVETIYRKDFKTRCPNGQYCLRTDFLDSIFSSFHAMMVNQAQPIAEAPIAFNDIFSLEKLSKKILGYMDSPQQPQDARLYMLEFTGADTIPNDEDEIKCGSQIYQLELPPGTSGNMTEDDYQCRMMDVIANQASGQINGTIDWKLPTIDARVSDQGQSSSAYQNVNNIYHSIDPNSKKIGYLRDDYFFYTKNNSDSHPVERGIARMIKDMIAYAGLKMFDYNKGFNNPIEYMRTMGTNILASGIMFVDDDMNGSSERSLIHHSSAMTTTLFGASSALLIGVYSAVFALDFPIPIGKLHGPRYLVHAAADISNDSMVLQADKDAYILSALEPLGTQISMVMMIWGGFFGIFLPMVPTMIVIFAFIGWIFLAVEALIASPLIALGLCHPSSQQFFGAAESSIPLIFLLFLRPVLIVVSIFLAVIISYLSLYLLHEGMFGLLGSDGIVLGLNNFSNPSYTDYARFISVLLVYSYTAFMVIIQSFSLIGSLPDKVGSWIGQGPLGGQNALSQVLGVKQGFETAAQSAATGFGQASKGAASKQASSGALKGFKALLSGSDKHARELGSEHGLAKKMFGGQDHYNPKLGLRAVIREEEKARGEKFTGGKIRDFLLMAPDGALNLQSQQGRQWFHRTFKTPGQFDLLSETGIFQDNARQKIQEVMDRDHQINMENMDQVLTLEFCNSFRQQNPN